MDGSRFDQLTRALGRGISRRAALKTALGLGGAVAAGQQIAPVVDAAARPTPTPKPVACPGQQHWNGTRCVCPNDTSQCGPDCCPAGAACCDNACCSGQCYGEELCCPSGSFVCNGECIPGGLGSCCTNDDCTRGEACVQGVCQQVCMPNLSTGCESYDDCCSGICQGHQCVGTFAGTCGAGYDVCDGSHGFEACGNNGGCKCAETNTGPICSANWGCVESCDSCELVGGYCAPGGQCCPDDTYPFTCYIPCGIDGGNICFTGETRIAMADGTSRPIADIRAGDLVLGDDGVINRVEGIDIPLLGNRSLHGFNGERPFVTASHPFQTDDGWKAIDPATTYRDHLLPGVGQLRVGDRLVLLSGVLVPAGSRTLAEGDPVEIRTESLPVERIDASIADPSMQLYNLRLDGNHTYFANDLLVHNK